MTSRGRRYAARVAHAAALAAAGVALVEIAVRMRRPARYVSQLLCAARKRGQLDPDVVFRDRNHDAGPDLHVAAEPHCPRCQLRGEHTCLPTSAWYGGHRKDAA